ncbi:MAG TPA: hypothetical protein VF139_17985 [Candidatus Polarisedimenticolaceae bacterium]
MNLKSVLATLLIVLGVVAFAYEGFSYTTRGEGMQLGPIHMTTERSHRVPLSPLVGGLALAGGIVLLVSDGKRLGGPATS